MNVLSSKAIWKKSFFASLVFKTDRNLIFSILNVYGSLRVFLQTFALYSVSKDFTKIPRSSPTTTRFGEKFGIYGDNNLIGHSGFGIPGHPSGDLRFGQHGGGPYGRPLYEDEEYSSGSRRGGYGGGGRGGGYGDRPRGGGGYGGDDDEGYSGKSSGSGYKGGKVIKILKFANYFEYYKCADSRAPAAEIAPPRAATAPPRAALPLRPPRTPTPRPPPPRTPPTPPPPSSTTKEERVLHEIKYEEFLMCSICDLLFLRFLI